MNATDHRKEQARARKFCYSDASEAAQYIPNDYYQVNRYSWDNGKQEEHQFPGTYHDNKLWFDTERIQGQAWEADDATVILRFTYKSVPDFYLYEMIQISPCNQYRSRTWHWFKANQLFQRTLIQETRVS